MHNRLGLVLVWCVCSGCGDAPVTPEPTFKDAVVEFEASVAEAESILSEPTSSASSGEEAAAEAIAATPPREVLRGVQTSAEELARAAVGHALEGEAKDIVAAAQSLCKKAESNGPVTELAAGLQQVRAKAESLKQRL
jgi:hypothetical protein